MVVLKPGLVPADLPVADIDALITLGHQRRLTYGSAGVGVRPP